MLFIGPESFFKGRNELFNSLSIYFPYFMTQPKYSIADFVEC